MAGFGEKLREARQQQGFSIAFVEEETKIRKLYLNALEEEDFAVLPPQVYANGFVKRYARFLKLDDEELSREFKELAYGSTETEEISPIPVKPKKESLLNQMPVRNIAIAAAFLLVVILAGNYLLGYLTDGLRQDNATKPPVIEEPAKPGDKNPEPESPQVSDTLNMEIMVKPQQKAWIQVRADGEEKLAKVLMGGDKQSFKAKDTIYIKVGNAAAVNIIIDGKQLEPLGGPGEVKEKEFKYGGKYTE